MAVMTVEQVAFVFGACSGFTQRLHFQGVSLSKLKKKGVPVRKKGVQGLWVSSKF